MPAPVVVCVDDDPVILAVLRAELRMHFRNLLKSAFCQSAEEAVELLKSAHQELFSGSAGKIALLVCDRNLPGMDGIEFLNQISESHPGIPAIMLTGDPESVPRNLISRSPESFSVLPKPWNRKELMQHIEHFIGDLLPEVSPVV